MHRPPDLCDHTSMCPWNVT